MRKSTNGFYTTTTNKKSTKKRSGKFKTFIKAVGFIVLVEGLIKSLKEK